MMFCAAMTVNPSSSLGVLTYASPQVRSSPPRTALRVIGAALLKLLRALLAAIRFAIVAIGYTVLAASIAIRFALAIVAIVFFVLGGVRWDVVRRRTLGTARWVDVKVLAMIAFFHRPTGGASR
jgi:hypothetical protein